MAKEYKTYIINWYKNTKYGDPVVCNNTIRAVSPKSATSLFMKVFGNLKKNTINYIQEINPETHENIGEPIIPNNNEDSIPAVKVVPAGEEERK